MDRKRHWRLVEVDAVMARWVVLPSVDWCNKVQVGRANRRNRCRRRLVRLNRRDLSLWCGARTEVVRERRPPLAETCRIHTWDHSHDVCDIGCCWDKVIGIVGQSNMKRLLWRNRLMLNWLGNISCLVENVVVTTVLGLVRVR